jgi:pentatricopeptide repeat protein
LDLEHYNRQFARCAILSNDKEALVCFKKMKEDGISPNVVTYNHMFKMFSKTRPQYVEALFVQMKAEGIEPDFV